MAVNATECQVEPDQSAIGVRPLIVVLAGTLMIVLDFFIVNVMLPSIQAGLHASSGELEWVIAGYGLPFAVFLITAGRLGDRFGRRRMFMLGIAVFTLASVACAVAWSATSLVAARVLQGVGAALISPNVLSIIGVLYTGRERLRALRSYGLVMGLGAIGGQILGGLLIHADIAGLSWRAAFLVNIPVGIAAWLLSPKVVPESRAERPQRLDIGGMGLISAALVLLVLPLVQGRDLGWPAWSFVSLACAPVALAAFGAYQVRLVRRGREPLLDPRLFRRRAFSAGLATQVTFWCGQASFFLVLTLYLQDGRGLSALQAGLVFTIMAAAFVAASLRAPGLTGRFGRELIAVGALTVVAGDVALLVAVSQIGVGSSVAWLAPGLLLVGAGQGLCITPLAGIVMAGLDPQQAGAASGPLSTMQQVGNSVGVAITGVVFFEVLAHHGFANALMASLAQLGVLALLAAAVSQLIPGSSPRPGRGVRRVVLRFVESRRAPAIDATKGGS